jgi:hypothetical protein
MTRFHTPRRVLPQRDLVTEQLLGDVAALVKLAREFDQEPAELLWQLLPEV